MNKSFFLNIVKGFLMGAANVIPGVSGGTMAFVTGIYEGLIGGLKSMDLKALRMITSADFNGFWSRVNGRLLLAIFIGVGLSIISLAKLLEVCIQDYPVPTFAYFFGLILASVPFVGKTIRSWTIGPILSGLIGTAIAIGISFVNPAQENTNALYLFICGVMAISSMILPGLSGSFILLIMGNYVLVLSSLTKLDFVVILPFALGCVFGLLVFSHVLNWLFKKYKDITISSLSGFILGSLLIIWPWKEAIEETLKVGNKTKIVVKGYNWFLPSHFDFEFGLSLLLIIVGIASVWGIEKLAGDKEE
jgi:putative membrane protein